MTTKEINILLALRDKTPKSIATAIQEDSSQVSATINYLRKNIRIRKKIAEHLGMPVEELFSDAPVMDAGDTSTRPGNLKTDLDPARPQA